MKCFEIPYEIYHFNLDVAEWYDEDCDCFGIDYDGKFYLYLEEYYNNDFHYSLILFDDTLENLLCNDEFVAKLAEHKLKHNPDNFCDFCGFISDCMNGNADINKRPFELRDIAYSMNDLIKVRKYN